MWPQLGYFVLGAAVVRFRANRKPSPSPVDSIFIVSDQVRRILAEPNQIAFISVLARWWAISIILGARQTRNQKSEHVIASDKSAFHLVEQEFCLISASEATCRISDRVQTMYAQSLWWIY